MRVEDSDRSRPFAYADPRSLSRAWFDALYGERATAKVPAAPAPHAQAATTAAAPAAMSPRTAAVQTSAEPPQTAAEGIERTSARTGSGTPVDSAAATMERTERATRAVPQTAEAAGSERTDVDVADGSGHSMKLLIAQRGVNVEVVAVCERGQREHAADALARARIALGARGIALQHVIRERGEG